MSKKVYKKVMRAPSHAGRILKSGFIEQNGLRVETVADLLGVTRQHLSRILNGRSPVTSDIAIKLEIITETPASQWLAIQSKYDVYMLEQREEYKKYKSTIKEWASKSLSLEPNTRRADPATIKRVEQASSFAKTLGQKQVAVSSIVSS